GSRFGIEEKKSQLAKLEEKMTYTNFWEDNDAAQTVIQKLNGLKNNVEQHEKISSSLEDSFALYEMIMDENDEDLFEELDQEVKKLIKALNNEELEML